MPHTITSTLATMVAVLVGLTTPVHLPEANVARQSNETLSCQAQDENAGVHARRRLVSWGDDLEEENSEPRPSENSGDWILDVLIQLASIALFVLIIVKRPWRWLVLTIVGLVIGLVLTVASGDIQALFAAGFLLAIVLLLVFAASHILDAARASIVPSEWKPTPPLSVKTGPDRDSRVLLVFSAAVSAASVGLLFGAGTLVALQQLGTGVCVSK